MIFFPGLHQPSDARHFPRACISINRLRARRRPIGARLMVDSGAFTELNLFGRYRSSVASYAEALRRLHGCMPIEIAVSQDFMCEPFILEKTGGTIPEHQAMTIQRFDELTAERLPFQIMPVLQGFAPEDYARHVVAYGDRLRPGAWVGVGSVCKRNADPASIVRVIRAIRDLRPDLRLHGFGVKLTSLLHAEIRRQLYSADSMAWSFAARRNGRNANDYREALEFVARIEDESRLIPWQLELGLTPR